jgi:hypothetical protein
MALQQLRVRRNAGRDSLLVPAYRTHIHGARRAAMPGVLLLCRAVRSSTETACYHRIGPMERGTGFRRAAEPKHRAHRRSTLRALSWVGDFCGISSRFPTEVSPSGTSFCLARGFNPGEWHKRECCFQHPELISTPGDGSGSFQLDLPLSNCSHRSPPRWIARALKRAKNHIKANGAGTAALCTGLYCDDAAAVQGWSGRVASSCLLSVLERRRCRSSSSWL